MGLRFKDANVTHPELKTTFKLPILSVKKNPQSNTYTSLGVVTKGTYEFICRYSIRSKRFRVGFGNTDGEGGVVEVRAGDKQSGIGRMYKRNSPRVMGVYLKFIIITINIIG